MTNRTRALGYRVLGSLKNERVMIVTSTSTRLVSLVNTMTGKTFAAVYESDYGYVLHTQDGSHEHSFTGLIGAIKDLPSYPAARERGKSPIKGAVRKPQFIGVKVG